MRSHSTNPGFLTRALFAVIVSVLLFPGTSHAQGKSAASPAPLTPDLEAATQFAGSNDVSCQPNPGTVAVCISAGEAR